MRNSHALWALAGVAMLCALPAWGGTLNLANLAWSPQYMIDESQTVLGQGQSDEPRDNRGLALSPDGRYLYLGYNNGPEVRKIDLTVADYTDATLARTDLVRGKAIAVDDQGRVYCAEGSVGYIRIFDPNLGGIQHSIAATKCEGVTVTREGGTLVLYGTDRNDDTLTRWELTESSGAVTGHTQAGLGGTGQITVTGADELRGCTVDSSGRIWMADYGAGAVFRVDNDGTNLTSQSIGGEPMDIAIDEDQVLVTQYTSRTITVLDTSDLSIESVLGVPWAALSLDPTGQSGNGALSGIDLLPGEGFFVANEAGQTADMRSIYGRDDGNGGMDGGTYYTDLTEDDNDPVLFATPVPEPISMIFFGTGMAGIAGFVVRRRRR